MRSILVIADRTPAMSARLESALSLARANDGHVTVLVNTPLTRYIAMDPMGGSHLAAEALNQALADDEALAASIRDRLGTQDVPFDVLHSEAEPVDAIAQEARFADVVVMSRVGDMAGDVALTCRTPVLVVEDERVLGFPVNRACIAWDGGNEAASALRFAAPVLAGCGQVDVLTVIEKEGGFPATDALRYLSRHGVKAELREVPRTGSTEESLHVAVRQAGADLLVMGAYGKSRMREFLFGGVTRFMLSGNGGPALLLAH
ncbi:MAG: universal stress protein [Novosphingobium sp.]|nr:universal stress protein [Novosphingobium sp.]